MPYIRFAFDGYDQAGSDTQGPSVALSNAMLSVSGGDHRYYDIQCKFVTPLTDPYTKFAFDVRDHDSHDIQVWCVAPSNAINSVSGGDQGSIDTHWLYVAPLADPLIQFAFDGRDHAKRDTHQMCVALSNAMPSVGGGDHLCSGNQAIDVTPLTDPLAFDSCNQTCVDTHPAGIALSNSVSGGDHIGNDIRIENVIPLADPFIEFAFDGCDQWECDIQIIPVALSDAMFSVGGGDHIKNDIQSFVVTPLTDPLLKFAFDNCDHTSSDTHCCIVALSNASPSVSGSDHSVSDIQ